MIRLTLLLAFLALCMSKSGRSALLRLLDFNASSSKARQVNWPLVALLVGYLAMVTIHPEARIFLMFLDAVGVDFFLLLLACQGRANFWLLRDHGLIPLWRYLKMFAPFPMNLPTRNVIREFPYLSATAVAGMSVSVIAITALGLMSLVVLPFALLVT